jgi:hypothetical protein
LQNAAQSCSVISHHVVIPTDNIVLSIAATKPPVYNMGNSSSSHRPDPVPQQDPVVLPLSHDLESRLLKLETASSSSRQANPNRTKRQSTLHDAHSPDYSSSPASSSGPTTEGDYSSSSVSSGGPSQTYRMQANPYIPHHMYRDPRLGFSPPPSYPPQPRFPDLACPFPLEDPAQKIGAGSSLHSAMRRLDLVKNATSMHYVYNLLQVGGVLGSGQLPHNKERIEWFANQAYSQKLPQTFWQLFTFEGQGLVRDVLLTVDIIRRERLRKHKSRLNRLHKSPVAASVTDNFSLVSGLLAADENFDDEWTIGGEQFPQQMLMDDPVGHHLTALDSTASDPPVAIHPPVALHHSPVALDHPLTIPFSVVESPMPKDLPVPTDLPTESDPPVAFPPPVALPHSPVALEYPLTIPFSVVESPMPKDLPVAIDFPVPLDSSVALDLPVVANFLIPDTSLLGSRVAQIFDNELYFGTVKSALLDDDGKGLYSIDYDDGDQEDYNFLEVLGGIHFAKANKQRDSPRTEIETNTKGQVPIDPEGMKALELPTVEDLELVGFETASKDRYCMLNPDFINFYPTVRNRREVQSLTSESLNILGRSSTSFATRNIAPSNSAVISPFHRKWRNQLNSNLSPIKKGKVSKRKPFDPKSVGDLSLKAGQWMCEMCSGINESDRPVYSCHICKKTPPRACQRKHASLVADNYRDNGWEEESESSLEISSSEDGYDEAFNASDERRILRYKKIERLGEIISLHDDITRKNFGIFCKWQQLVPNPAGKVYTVFFPPKDRLLSFMHLSSRLDLTRPKLLTSIIGQPYAIEKPLQSHAVIAFALHNSLHFVIHHEGMIEATKTSGRQPVIYANNVDLLFDDGNCYAPCVLNEHLIPGVFDHDFGLDIVPAYAANVTCRPPSLLSQITDQMQKGATDHLDEIIRLGSSEECRSIFSLHAGFTGVQGSAWTRLVTGGSLSLA